MFYYLFKGYHWMGNYTVLHWFIGQVVSVESKSKWLKKMRMPAKWHLFYVSYLWLYTNCLINIRTLGMIRKVWCNDTGKIKVFFIWVTVQMGTPGKPYLIFLFSSSNTTWVKLKVVKGLKYGMKRNNNCVLWFAIYR